MLSADAIWWARFWRRLRAVPRRCEWEWEEHPAGSGRYRALDETERLLDELEAALVVDDVARAQRVLRCLAGRVGTEPPPGITVR